MNLLLRIIWLLICLGIAVFYVRSGSALTAMLWGIAAGVMLADVAQRATDATIRRYSDAR